VALKTYAGAEGTTQELLATFKTIVPVSGTPGTLRVSRTRQGVKVYSDRPAVPGGAK
jgi:hypothetical protein